MNGPAYNTVRDRIEQAIACRWTLDQICDRLHVDPSEVDTALRRMDAAVASITRPCPRKKHAA